LIILALLTILGIASTNTSTLEVRIATNSQDHQLDFYVADSGWKDAAMFLEDQSGVPAWINGEGTVVKNFGSDGNTFTGEPPVPDFNVLTPDSLHADGVDNNGDGNTDEAGESAFNSRYNIDYFYEVEHLPDETSKVSGSSMKYRRHFFMVTSDAKRQNFDNSTAEVAVSLSKVYPTGYN
ncbi:MAG: hypothetical protein JRF72_05500, partial [Deltaproteobacteria bacterium]|jgi:hypothetical protein|nr:hypothetical protein [Deltaproteobacteria bacterium]